MHFPSAASEGKPKNNWFESRRLLWRKKCIQSPEAGPLIRLLRKVQGSVISQVLCPLCLPNCCVSSESSHQAKVSEDLQSLHFTWLYMKGRLSQREQDSCRVTLGVRLSFMLTALSKSLAM